VPLLFADLIVVLHFAFVAFVVAGGLLALRWPRIAWLHLPAAAWGAWIEASGAICPLTPWENRLRRLAGESGYPGCFVEHYLIPLIYPAGLTATSQRWLAALVVLVNVAVYAAIVALRWRRQRRR